KVWICKGEVLSKRDFSQNIVGDEQKRAPRGVDKRAPRGDRNDRNDRRSGGGERRERKSK
ncbi:MAG TPA: 30S ribosomal protein S3, partial [Chitinophagales bacterium]|nr:30S ribosomal protein S3 [Chitinophagales bacterium]